MSRDKQAKRRGDKERTRQGCILEADPWFGHTATDVTYALHPPVPKHSGHPLLEVAPSPSHNRTATDVTAQSLSRSNSPAGPDYYYGRRDTDVTAHLQVQVPKFVNPHGCISHAGKRYGREELQTSSEAHSGNQRVFDYMHPLGSHRPFPLSGYYYHSGSKPSTPCRSRSESPSRHHRSHSPSPGRRRISKSPRRSRSPSPDRDGDRPPSRSPIRDGVRPRSRSPSPIRDGVRTRSHSPGKGGVRPRSRSPPSPGRGGVRGRRSRSPSPQPHASHGRLPPSRSPIRDGVRPRSRSPSPIRDGVRTRSLSPGKGGVRHRSRSPPSPGRVRGRRSRSPSPQPHASHGRIPPERNIPEKYLQCRNRCQLCPPCEVCARLLAEDRRRAGSYGGASAHRTIICPFHGTEPCPLQEGYPCYGRRPWSPTRNSPRA